MPINQAEAQAITLAFVRDYPGALALAYRFRENTGELYGHRAAEVPADLKGGYVPKETIHNGRAYRGRVDVPLANTDDAADLVLTLRHEVLGHYGANTFKPAEKRALLEGLIAAREEPGLKLRWDEINRRYVGASLDVRAEEVWALNCESIVPGQHVGQAQVLERGQQSFMETCIARTRPMQVRDLHSIACMVAQGLHDRSRTQQTFPEINEQFRRGEAVEPKKPFHEVVAEKLIEQINAGTAPWQRPWASGEPNAYLPMNPTTGKRYKGINAIHLMAQDHSDARWMTYKQAAGVGAQVRKGEKGTPVQYWKFTEEQDRLDEQGRPMRDAEGKQIKVTVELERPRMFFATVFNGEQIEGLPSRQPKTEQKWDALDRAEHILQASGARIIHSAGDRAFYRPATDSITLPEKGQFERADRYYATALHELGHWTGHASRLARDLAHPFGSEGYAKEELRAEIASMIVGDELGIGHDPSQHAAYVGSWVKVLQDDPMEIFRASSEAEKIHGYVLAFEQQQVQEQSQQQNREAAMQAPVDIHVMPGRLVDRLFDQGVMSRPDAEVTSALRDLRMSAEATRTIDLEVFSQASQEAFGFVLPADWSGYARVQGNVLDGEGEQQSVTAAASLGVDPEFHGVYARLEDGTYQWLADRQSSQAADDLVQRLAAVDAHSEVNELDRAAKLARIHEDRVRRDPNSSDEDISAAKEARKAAEAMAVSNDADMQRRVAELQQAEKPERHYIDVPYKEKDEVRALGARWDRQKRSWFVPTGMDAAPFVKWAQGASAAAVEPRADQQARQYLAVPYEQRNAAKAAGALWDKSAKSWYVGPRADLAKLERWQPENVQAQQGPAMTPREEFAEAMRSVGLFVGTNAQGDHPIMDGKRHRVPVEGGKKGALDGFYVGHLDGHPAGRIINNKSGADLTWKSKGYALGEEEKARLRVEAAGKLAARAAEQERLQEATAQRVRDQMADLVAIEQPTPYLQVKGIKAHAGVFTDREGQKTYIPAFDAHGKLWTMQYIQEDGTKRFAKDARKEGCFHPVGGMEALTAAPALVISEGYATAATNAEALWFATVAAFDSGNLPHVARALHEQFPDKPVIIAGDDDRHLVMTHGNNPGREKAEAAAQAVDGKAIFPIFAPGENAYPSDLSAITPDSYKTHLRAEQRLADAIAGKVERADDEAAKLRASMLSDAQIAALSTMKQHTDFNDLAHKSELGREGVNRQVNTAVGKVLIDVAQQHTNKLELEQRQERRPNRSARIG